MKGDFSRDTFNPAKHYSRVLEQQGRPQMDADSNEQIAILMHYLRTLAGDIGGPYWGPANNFGFEINSIMDSNGNPTDDFTIGKGRYYVDGILCENDNRIKFSDQAGFIEEKDAPKAGKNYYVYLDVWERLITHIQDEHIRETALGVAGSDTCVRAQVTWRVKLKEVGAGEAADCAGAGISMDNLPKLSGATLKARLHREHADDNACSVPPESRYRGAENQLYRIEVHHGGIAWNGTAGNVSEAATFKWSRDNGSVVFSIIQQSGAVITLQSLGRDQRTGLNVNDWVEIMDDDLELRGDPGILAQVDEVDQVMITVTLKLPKDVDPANPKFKWPTYPATKENHPVLRRWNYEARKDMLMSQGAILVSKSEESWIQIENGIEIQFESNGAYRTGDYWLIPARVETGKIEWPLKIGTDGAVDKYPDGSEKPESLPPHGVEHHYAPLGVIENQQVTARCRCKLDRVSESTNTEISAFILDCTDPLAPEKRAGSTAPKAASVKRASSKSG